MHCLGVCTPCKLLECLMGVRVVFDLHPDLLNLPSSRVSITATAPSPLNSTPAFRNAASAIATRNSGSLISTRSIVFIRYPCRGRARKWQPHSVLCSRSHTPDNRKFAEMEPPAAKVVSRPRESRRPHPARAVGVVFIQTTPCLPWRACCVHPTPAVRRIEPSTSRGR